MQGRRSTLNHEEETTTVPFGQDLTGSRFLLAEQQSEWTQEGSIDLPSDKHGLHTVMNAASVAAVPSIGLEGGDERSINTGV